MPQKFIMPSQYQINVWGWIAYLDPIEQENVKRYTPKEKNEYYKRIKKQLLAHQATIAKRRV